MFRRRRKIRLDERLREFVWPRIGWGRATRYLMHRMSRLSGTPRSIAAGFACGAAISFTPFVGLHLLLAALIAWLIRANVIASAVGTIIGNPWTFPFIWIWIYKSGRWLGAGQRLHGVEDLDFSAFFGNMLEATLSFDLPYLLETAAPVFWPMLVGSVPTVIAAGFGSYFLLRLPVAQYQARRLRRRLRRGRGHRVQRSAEERRARE